MAFRVERPTFLSNLFPEGSDLNLDLMREKFNWLQKESRVFANWDPTTMRLFQKTYSYRNRYVNRLPYEHSRVKLDTERNLDRCDYINGSFLRFEPGDDMTYIATQAPIPRTFGDFWQMVSEQGVQLIVMLVVADGLKCDRYWPEREGEIKFPTGVTVKYNGTLARDDTLAIKEFILIDEHDESRQRTVRLYNFLAWPDHDIPESTGPLLTMMKKLWDDPLYTSPVLVHCSAGVGRTGTFCVIDAFIRMSRKSKLLTEQHDPVIGITLAYRKQRISIVETFSQFCFIYQFLHSYYASNSNSL